MYLSFEFPFTDTRYFLKEDTYRLNPKRDMDLGTRSVINNEFIRSFGLIQERKNPGKEIQEKIFASAKKSFSFDPSNSFVFSKNKRFVPKVFYRRLFTDGKNSRIDVGIKNALHTNYSSSDIDEIIRALYSLDVFIPRHNKSKTLYKKIKLKELGKSVSALYLNSTTSLPKENSPKLKKDWIVSGSTMVLCQIKDEERVKFDFGDYINIEIDNLSELGIELYYKKMSGIYSNYNVPVWLIAEGKNAKPDKVRNLRIYLMKLHEERECFRQILNHFHNEIFESEDFGSTKKLSDYIKNYVYESLLKKSKYGYSNRLINEIVHLIDKNINDSEIDSLLKKFGTVNLEKIKEELDNAMKNNTITINGNVGNVGDINGNPVFNNNTAINNGSNENLSQLIDEIRKITGLQDGQRENLIKYLEEAESLKETEKTKEADTETDERKSLKSRFEGFIKGLGDAADKIMPVIEKYKPVAEILGIVAAQLIK